MNIFQPLLAEPSLGCQHGGHVVHAADFERLLGRSVLGARDGAHLRRVAQGPRQHGLQVIHRSGV